MIEPLRRGQRVGEQRREPQRREDVGLVGGPQRLDRDRGDRVHRRDAERVVDQAVDPAELLERPLDQRRPRLLVGDVGRYDERAAAVRADHLGHLLEAPLGAADEHQVGAHPGGLLAQRPAQARADAGEDDDLVLQQGDRLVASATEVAWWVEVVVTCARLERVPVLVESASRPDRPDTPGWPRGHGVDYGSRPSTPDTWERLRGTGRADRRSVQRLLVRPLPPRCPRRPRRGRDATATSSTAWSRRASRTPRWSTTATGRRRLGRVRHARTSCPTSTTASSTTPKRPRPTLASPTTGSPAST